CVGIVSCLECDRERLLEQLDRVLGVAEQEVEPPEVVRELTDMDAVGELRVSLPRPLGVIAGQHPVALAVGDERSLEVRGADREEIVDTPRQLECPLDVVPGSLVIALTLPAARTPGEDVRLEGVARQPGSLRERECLVEQGERRVNARKLVAAAAEASENVGP